MELTYFNNKMGWRLRLLIGYVCIIFGGLLTLTIIGSIIGLPLMIVGYYIFYRNGKEIRKGIIKQGIKELDDIKEDIRSSKRELEEEKKKKINAEVFVAGANNDGAEIRIRD